jgi:PKD repeat protein
MKTKVLFIFFYLCNLILFGQNYSRVKVFGNNDEISRLGELGVAVDHGIRKEGIHFISDFSKEEISIMSQNNFSYEIVIQDVEAYYIELLNDQKNKKESAPTKNINCSNSTGDNSYSSPEVPANFNLGTMGGYLKYNEMLAELDAMATQYPNLITTKAPISNFLTFENRPIYYVRISDNPTTDESGEPKILYTAIHHAREPMSLMETIFYMWYLLENYGTNEEIRYLVNNTQMYFVPCINPDGYVYNETTNPNGGGMWRKNRRNNGNGTYGVDLNRNYSYGWGTTGTSTNTSNETYCGTAPFSEPETQAMRWLVQNNDFKFAFNAHTYAEDILFPIGTTNAEFADHHDYFQAYTNHMAEYNGYTAMKSSGLYPASGDSDDYEYKVDIGVGVKDTIFVHTPEVGTAFWQPQSEIIPTCQEMFFPNLVLAHLAKKYCVVKDIDDPSMTSISGNFNHSIQRFGRESGPVSVSIQPLLNISSVGNSLTYDLNQMQSSTGSISYTLNPTIQFGNIIKYVLITDYGIWKRRDTITKSFGSYNLQATEDASATANWTGNWSTTTNTFVSPSKSFFDGSLNNYSNNANKTFAYNPLIDLTNAGAAKISFYAKWALETDYDFVQFQVSTDGGNTWIGQCGNYTVLGVSGGVQPVDKPLYEGTMTNWVLEEINLSEYLGQSIKVRFQLRSDGGTTADGFYFDDFQVFVNPSEPLSAPFSQFSYSSNTACLGNNISFADNSTNVPTQWLWNFGDGTTSNEQNPTHVFNSTGTFNITLTASNTAGNSSSTQQIEIFPNPILSISSSDTDNVLCLQDGAIDLQSNPTGAQFFGTGVNGNTFNPQVSGIGNFTISAEYIDANGCAGYSELSIEVTNCSSNELIESDKSAAIIFPNPTNGLFELKGFDSNTDFEIHDMNGKLLHSGQVINNMQLSVSQISAGIYYLSGMSNGSSIKIKFIIVK